MVLQQQLPATEKRVLLAVWPGGGITNSTLPREKNTTAVSPAELVGQTEFTTLDVSFFGVGIGIHNSIIKNQDLCSCNMSVSTDSIHTTSRWQKVSSSTILSREPHARRNAMDPLSAQALLRHRYDTALYGTKKVKKYSKPWQLCSAIWFKTRYTLQLEHNSKKLKIVNSCFTLTYFTSTNLCSFPKLWVTAPEVSQLSHSLEQSPLLRIAQPASMSSIIARSPITSPRSWWTDVYQVGDKNHIHFWKMGSGVCISWYRFAVFWCHLTITGCHDFVQVSPWKELSYQKPPPCGRP